MENSVIENQNLKLSTLRLFDEQRSRLYVRTDKLFGALLVFEWIAGVIAALLFSPLSWSGNSSSVHIHVWFAILFGAALALFPLSLIALKPGSALTRHVIAVSQMLFSAMYIHLCGGRIETHFHIFGSLALLAFYRDWRVIVTASSVIAFDHFLRGYFWPQSLFGVNFASPWRAVEHVAWVVFADIFLLQGISQSVREMQENANNTARLENTNEVIERAVAEQTAQLVAGERELQRLAAVVQQSGDAIVSMSMDGTIRSWNYGAEKLFQYTAQEMIGHMYNPPLPEAVKKDHKNLLKIIRNGESVDGMETLGCRKDGSFVDISLTISPVRGADSEINAFAAVARDITQKKIAEKRISEFYSVISHELRTPLTSIRGALALISEGIVEPGSTEAAELVDIAQSSTSRLIRLINDILDLRKIEAGKFELNLVDIRSIDLIKSAVSYMHGFAEEKRVSLVANVSDDYQVEGDLDRLTQVLSNLISNAVKYAPEGSVVEVSAVKAQHAMRFMVSDSGPGIPAEYHSKLFGKFEQVDASDRRTKEGSGLGLAISKAIVEQHGGTITFESVPGVRTVFEFEIPLSNAHIFAAPFATSALPAQSSKTDEAEHTGFELDEQSISGKEDDQGISSQIQTYQNVPALKPLRLVSCNADTSPTRTREKSATLESCSNLLNQTQSARSCSLSASRFGISGHFFPAFTEDELNSSIKRWPAPVRLEALSEMSAGSDTSITSTQSDMDDPNQGGSESRQQVSSPFRTTDRVKKILIVEDDIELASLLRINLERQNYLCLIAQTLEQARDLVASEAPDAVILDLELPDGDGLSLLEQLPGTARSGAKTPVIVITGSDRAAKKGESSIVDWLKKPFYQGNLSEAVDRAFKTEGQRKKVMIIDDDPETKMAVTAELSQLEINFVETSDCIDISRFDEGPQLDLIVFRESCLQGAEATRAFRKLRGRWSDYVPIIIYSSSELNGYGQQTASVSISHHMPKPGLEANFLAKVENVLFSFLSQTGVPGGSRMP